MAGVHRFGSFLVARGGDPDGEEARAGASLTLSDALVLDMVVGGPGDTGIGLLAVRGASLVAARVAIQGAVEPAVGADGDGTSIVVTDLLVRDTLVRPSDGLLGRAVDAQRGGTITGERVHVANSREGGVLAMGPGASVRLVDARRCVARVTQGDGRVAPTAGARSATHVVARRT